MESVDLLCEPGLWRPFGAAAGRPGVSGVPLTQCHRHRPLQQQQGDGNESGGDDGNALPLVEDNENVDTAGVSGHVHRGGVGTAVRVPMLAAARQIRRQLLASSDGFGDQRRDGFALRMNFDVSWDSDVELGLLPDTLQMLGLELAHESLANRTHEGVLYTVLHCASSRESPWGAVGRSAIVAGMPVFVAGLVFSRNADRNYLTEVDLFLEVWRDRQVVARDATRLARDAVSELSGGLRVGDSSGPAMLPLALEVVYDPRQGEVTVSTLHGTSSVHMRGTHLEQALQVEDSGAVFCSVGAHMPGRCANLVHWDWEGPLARRLVSNPDVLCRTAGQNEAVLVADRAVDSLFLAGVLEEDLRNRAGAPDFVDSLPNIRGISDRRFESVVSTLLDPLRPLLVQDAEGRAAFVEETMDRSVKMLSQLHEKLVSLQAPEGADFAIKDKLARRRGNAVAHFHDIYFGGAYRTAQLLWNFVDMRGNPGAVQQTCQRAFEAGEFTDVRICWSGAAFEGKIEEIRVHASVIRARAPLLWTELQSRSSLQTTTDGQQYVAIISHADTATAPLLVPEATRRAVERAYGVAGVPLDSATLEDAVDDCLGQHTKESLGSDLVALFEASQHPDDPKRDFTFVCGAAPVDSGDNNTPDPPVIGAHASLLALRSPIFAKMLFGSFDKARTLKVDVSEAAVRCLVSHIYGGFPTGLTPEVALELMSGCGHLLEDSLLACCDFAVRMTLSPKNCVGIYIAARDLQRNNLMSHCFDVMTKSILEAVKDPAFEELDEATREKMYAAADPDNARIFKMHGHLHRRQQGSAGAAGVPSGNTPKPKPTAPKKKGARRRRR